MMVKQSMTMAEVARLTRAGRLGDAMALLQGRRSPDDTDAGVSDAAAALPSASAGIRGLARTVEGFGADLLRPPGQSAIGPRRETVLPEGARFDARHFSNRFGSRAYRLYVPNRYDGQAMPLVVMLHGCQQTPEDFATGTRMNRLAEEQGIFVAYPEQPAAANRSRCWNWFVPGDQSRDGGEPSLIAGITRQIIQDVAVDRARVFVAGLSAGGAAAAIMGSAYPDLYAAVGVHSGLACGAARDIPSAFAAMKSGAMAPVGVPDRPRRTIVFHGDRDQTVSPVNGDQVIAQSKGSAQYHGKVSRGRSDAGVAYTRSVHADALGRPILEHWTLHGLGHAWSGGDPAGSFTDPRGPDASREMLRFFLSGSQPGGE